MEPTDIQESFNVNFFLQTLIVCLITILGWMWTRLYNKVEEAATDINEIRNEHSKEIVKIDIRLTNAEADIKDIYRQINKD